MTLYQAQAIENVREYVRERYGPHRILHAPDGGCRICPLGPMDPIHYWPRESQPTNPISPKERTHP